VTELVLVLGAGASHHCGFPLGRKLLELVHHRAQIDETHRGVNLAGRAKDWHPKPDEQLAIIQKDAWDSGFVSIDRFIKERPLIAPAAKVLVAHVLRERERGSDLGRHPNGCWYEYLWNWAADGVRDGQRRARIVTLNYERSLEEFLRRRAMAAFGWTDVSETMKRIDKALPILHLHGSFGSLAEVPYWTSAGDEWEDAARAAAGIRTLGEKIPDEYLIARMFLFEADSIAFLGTSFPSEVMDQLFTADAGWPSIRRQRHEDERRKPADVYASAMLPQSEWARTKARYLEQITGKRQIFDCYLGNCLETLHKLPILP